MRNQRFVSIFFFLTMWVMTTFFVAKGQNENPVSVVNNVEPMDTNILFNEIISKGDGGIQSSNRFIDKIKNNPKKSIAAATTATAGTAGIINSLTKEEPLDKPVKDGKSMVVKPNDPASNKVILAPKPVFNNPVPMDENITNLSMKDENKSISINPSPSLPLSSSSHPSAMSSVDSKVNNSSLKKKKTSSKEQSFQQIEQPATPIQGSKNGEPQGKDSLPQGKEASPQGSPKHFNQTTKNKKGVMGKKIHVQGESLIIEDEVVNNAKAKEELINNLKRIPMFFKWSQLNDHNKILNDILNYENNFHTFKEAYGNKDLKKFLNNMNVLNTVKDFFLQVNHLLDLEKIFQQISIPEALKIYTSPEVLEVDPAISMKAIPVVQSSPSNQLFDQSSINFNPKDIMVLNENDNSIQQTYGTLLKEKNQDANGSAFFQANPTNKYSSNPIVKAEEAVTMFQSNKNQPIASPLVQEVTAQFIITDDSLMPSTGMIQLSKQPKLADNGIPLLKTVEPPILVNLLPVINEVAQSLSVSSAHEPLTPLHNSTVNYDLSITKDDESQQEDNKVIIDDIQPSNLIHTTQQNPVMSHHDPMDHGSGSALESAKNIQNMMEPLAQPAMENNMDKSHALAQEKTMIQHFVQQHILEDIILKSEAIIEEKIAIDHQIIEEVPSNQDQVIISEVLNNIINTIEEKDQQNNMGPAVDQNIEINPSPTEVINREPSQASSHLLSSMPLPVDTANLVKMIHDHQPSPVKPSTIKVITDVANFPNDTLTSKNNMSPSSSDSSSLSIDSSQQIKTFDIAEDTQQPSMSSGSDIPEETQSAGSNGIEIATNKPSFRTIMINYKPQQLIKDHGLAKAYEVAQQYKLILEYYKVLSKTDDTNIIESQEISWKEQPYQNLLSNFESIMTININESYGPLEKLQLIYQKLYGFLATNIKDNLENFYTNSLMNENYDYSQLIIHRERIIKFINLNMKWLEYMQLPMISLEIINNMNYFIGTLLIYNHQWDPQVHVEKFLQQQKLDDKFINNIKDLKIIELMGQSLRSDAQSIDKKQWESHLHLAFKSPKNFQWLLEAYIKNSLNIPSDSMKLKDFIGDVNDYITAQKLMQGGDLNELMAQQSVHYNNLKDYLLLLTNYMNDRKELIKQVIQSLGKSKNMPISKIHGGIEMLDAKHHIHLESLTPRKGPGEISDQQSVYKKMIGHGNHSKKNSMVSYDKSHELTKNLSRNFHEQGSKTQSHMRNSSYNNGREEGFFTQTLQPVMDTIKPGVENLAHQWKPAMDNLTLKVTDTWNNFDHQLKNFFTPKAPEPIHSQQPLMGKIEPVSAMENVNGKGNVNGKNVGKNLKKGLTSRNEGLSHNEIHHNNQRGRGTIIAVNERQPIISQQNIRNMANQRLMENPMEQPLSQTKIPMQGPSNTIIGRETSQQRIGNFNGFVKFKDFIKPHDKGRGSSETREQLNFKPLLDNKFIKEYEEALKQQEIEKQIQKKVNKKSSPSSNSSDDFRLKSLSNLNEISGIPVDQNKTYVADLTNVIKNKDDEFSGESA